MGGALTDLENWYRPLEGSVLLTELRGQTSLCHDCGLDQRALGSWNLQMQLIRSLLKGSCCLSGGGKKDGKMAD